MKNAVPLVQWTTFHHPFFQNRPLHLARTEQGLCRVTWPTETFETLRTWVEQKIPNAVLVEDATALEAYVQHLHEYVDGTRKSFTLPVDMRGTAFQQAVWQALTKIPYGETRSYSEIAHAIGNPQSVRAVGTANGANPVPIIVPCHRVIGKNATLTGFRGGLQVKETLLQLEGYHDFTNKGHARFQF